jgi:cytochrome c553
MLVGAGICTPGQPAEAQTRVPPRAVAACAPCHGVDGVGRDIEVPNIAGQHSIYLRKQLLAFRNGTRRHPEMQLMARSLNEREIDQVILYYSLLPSP